MRRQTTTALGGIMDRLLNVIASELSVRLVVDEKPEGTLQEATFSMQIFKYRDVGRAIKELFQKELTNHLCTKLQDLKYGEEVTYCFAYGKVNNNLEEVFLKLPALNDGEAYNLPCDTLVRFTITKKTEEEILVNTSASSWIVEAVNKQ